jgi:hypothetical protein
MFRHDTSYSHKIVFRFETGDYASIQYSSPAANQPRHRTCCKIEKKIFILHGIFNDLFLIPVGGEKDAPAELIIAVCPEIGKLGRDQSALQS